MIKLYVDSQNFSNGEIVCWVAIHPDGKAEKGRYDIAYRGNRYAIAANGYRIESDAMPRDMARLKELESMIGIGVIERPWSEYSRQA